MTQTVRPPTVPTPVTTPSAGVSASWLRAKSQSSWNAVPGSSRSVRRSRTKSLPSARSFSRYLTWPCSMRVRSRWYRSSPSPTWSPRSVAAAAVAGIGPDDDDQHAVRVARAADDRGMAGRRLDVRHHLGRAAAHEADAHADGAGRHRVRRHLELAVAGNRPALCGADGHLRAIALHGGVLAVAEELAQAGEEVLQALVGPLGHAAHARRRRPLGGEENTRAEADHLLRERRGR